MNSHKPIVLIAEDELLIRDLLKQFLTKEGFEVLVARDGQEAVATYRKRHHAIDLVLLDLDLPRVDGPAVFEVMKEFNPDVVCCFMTGGSDRYNENALLESGAAFFLQKPFAVAEIPQILRRILQRRQAQI